MTDILDEIDEDLRAQQLKAFWKENGPWIIGGALLALVMTAGMSFWRDWQDKKNMRETSGLMAVLNQEDIEKLSSYADKAHGPHKVFARLMEAGLLIQHQEQAKAVALYDAIAQDRKTDPLWRTMARVQSLSLRIDTDDPKKLSDEISDLVAMKKNPWKWSALELQAMLYARTGDYHAAVKSLEGIASSPEAPESMKGRVAALRDLYAGRGGKP